MSDETPKEDRQFEPTARRKAEFRRDGRVAVSKDLASAAQLVAILLGFMVVGNAILTGIYSTAAWVFENAGSSGGGNTPTFGDVVTRHLDALALPTLALCVFVGAVTVIAYLLQTSFMFSTKNLGFKWDKLRPLKRMAQLFGPKKLAVTSLLTLGKIGLTGMVLALALAEVMPRITSLSGSTIGDAAALTSSELQRLMLITVVILGVMAVLDFIWQRRQHAEQLRMTRDEIKRDSEEEEGRPEIKHRRRKRHRELSMNRILDAVPTADVIVTNPTHYAVALRYQALTDRAPMVVAKGADEIAAHIRTIARHHAVPIIENKPLARTLWARGRVGKAIPTELFQAVAQVLARVYKARRSTLGR